MKKEYDIVEETEKMQNTIVSLIEKSIEADDQCALSTIAEMLAYCLELADPEKEEITKIVMQDNWLLQTPGERQMRREYY